MTPQEMQARRKEEVGKFDSISYFYQAKPEDKIAFSFKYNGDPDDIHCLQPSCGCTTVTMKDNIISGVLEIDPADKLFVPGDTSPNRVLTRSISVYFDADEPFYDVEDKIRKVNPNKLQVALSIQGTIINTNLQTQEA